MKSFFIWNRAPALQIALPYLCGTLFSLCSAWALMPLPFLIATRAKSTPLFVFLFLLPLFVTQNFYKKVEEGTFRIQSIHYNYSWIYRGKLGGNNCTISVKEPLNASHHYHVVGSWKSNTSFKPTTLEPIERSFSLANWRYESKQAVIQKIHRLFAHKRSATFIAGLLTGELEDLEMRLAFSDLGLLHLLAISGFHFGILVFLLHHVLSHILPRKIEIVVLMVLMTLYALFIGNTPSLLRAWIFMMVYLGGELLEKKPYALNTLGVALFVALLIDPYSSLTVGFQLSFMATAGLLIFMRPIEQALCYLLPKPTLFEVTRHNYLIQAGYLLTAFFRELAALTLGVNIALLPLLLYHFHTFSPIGLIYNLFFPFLTSVALALLPLFPIADYFTEAILGLTEHSYGALYIEQMPLWLMTSLVTLIGIIGLCIEEWRSFLHRRSLGF